MGGDFPRTPAGPDHDAGGNKFESDPKVFKMCQNVRIGTRTFEIPIINFD